MTVISNPLRIVTGDAAQDIAEERFHNGDAAAMQLKITLALWCTSALWTKGSV